MERRDLPQGADERHDPGGRRTVELGRNSSCFLSELLGNAVIGSSGPLGRVQDVLATVSTRSPDIDGVVVRVRGGIGFVPLDSAGFLQLARKREIRVPLAAALPFAPTASQFLVREALYDRQIVDVNGARIRRVNDVQFSVRPARPYLLHVDVGFSGLLRRLGYEKAARRLYRLMGGHLHDEFIWWNSVLPLVERNTGPLQVSLRKDEIRRLHAGELADLIEAMDHEERIALLSTLDLENAADALEEVDLQVQTSVLRDMEPSRAADLLEEMESAVAADVVEELTAEFARPILAHMEKDERQEIERLTSADRRTAAALMTVDYVSCPPETTIEGAHALLRSRVADVEEIAYLYCLSADGHLVGVASLRDVLVAEPTAPLASIMNTRVTSVAPGDDWERVADAFLKYRWKAIPVLEEGGLLVGVVTFRHSFDELLPTYHRLAG